MISSMQLLRQLRQFADTVQFFRFPYMQVVVQSVKFAELEDSEREIAVSRATSISVKDLRLIAIQALLSIRYVTPAEFHAEFNGQTPRRRGFHWLGELSSPGPSDSALNRLMETASPRIVHFYGYKGGQARSTLLGLTSLSLADEEWRILSVDADIEAPSLDVLYGRTSYSVDGSLLGMQRPESKIRPERVYTPPLGKGCVDLISCRPRSTEFDFDAVAFSLRASLDPTVIESLSSRIFQFARSEDYDAVLIDHRSGLSASTPVWMQMLLGPKVICTRLDEQWRSAKSFINVILSTFPSRPGAFISWKQDEELEDTYRRRNNSQIDELLELLADVVRRSAADSTEISSVEVTDHLLVWPYDNAFRQSRLPAATQLSRSASSRILELRSLIGLSGTRVHASQVNALATYLDPSGARDEGDLIETDAFRQLAVRSETNLFASSSIAYIFGRKGTGKTRLVRELAKMKVGEPLLVSSDSGDRHGLKSNSIEFSAAVQKFRARPEELWWRLLYSAMQVTDTAEESLRAAFEEAVKADDISPTAILDRIDASRPRVFLLDGLETAFNGQQVFPFIDGLFRFLLSLETDSRFSQSIQLKLFLRTDLAERGYQNIEQQVSGRAIRLSWNTTKIFNFVLSRIPKKSWFCSAFPALVSDINQKKELLRKGEITTEDCEVLLLKAFPENLRRNNIATITFLRTYFADSATDASDRLTYYPRIFDTFLDVIDKAQNEDGNRYQGDLLEDSRISQGLIIFAHEEAASQYLKQLLSELNYLVTLSDDPSENEERIQSLLDAFSGLSTPFDLERRVAEVSNVVGLEPAIVRTAMDRMKRVGMFEDRPGYLGEWRVGRLFKSSLKMKYVR